MNFGESLSVIERFFLDIIGSLIPGCALIIGLSVALGIDLSLILKSLSDGFGGYAPFFVIGVCYSLGHALAGFGALVLRPVTDLVIVACSYGYRRFHLSRIAPFKRFASNFKSFLTRDELSKRLDEDVLVLAFRKRATTVFPELEQSQRAEQPFNKWRNLALALVKEQNSIVYRFTFLGLLNFGLAAAISVTIIFWVFAILGAQSGLLHGLRPSAWQILLAGLLVPFFLERAYMFYRIAQETPFSLGLCALRSEAQSSTTLTASPNENPERSRITIYLAGGFRSGWQTRFREEIENAQVLDPRSHNLSEPDQYTVWDLKAIERSDLVFAYLEAGNPGGFALALEMGFGKALRKYVVFVEDRFTQQSEMSRYLDMLRASADVNLTSLEEGIHFVKELSKIR